MKLEFLGNLIITSMLTCLIWLVQILHYPSFRYVDQNIFTKFESFHTTSISYIVMPLMLMELFLTSYMTLKDPKNFLLLISLVSVILIWISTFILSIPCHTRLALGHDSATIERLITTNWPRTILWSIKLILSILIIKGVSYERF